MYRPLARINSITFSCAVLLNIQPIKLNHLPVFRSVLTGQHWQLISLDVFSRSVQLEKTVEIQATTPCGYGARTEKKPYHKRELLHMHSQVHLFHDVLTTRLYKTFTEKIYPPKPKTCLPPTPSNFSQPSSPNQK